MTAVSFETIKPIILHQKSFFHYNSLFAGE